MARPTRPTAARRAQRLDFAALEVTGSLLTPDMIAQVAAFEAPGQNEAAYAIPKGLSLRDEIARAFRMAEATWNDFRIARDSDPGACEGFVLDLLRRCFGFESLESQQPQVLGDFCYPIRHAALGGRVPLVIAPTALEESRRSGLDEPLPAFGDGGRRRTASLLLQEYLNAAEPALWGLCSDGLSLRLLRDNNSLTRPAWIEADLARIFEEGLYPDFSALWLLIHQSRFGRAEAAVSDCPLESWRERGRNDGVAAREKLRQGVEVALIQLGQGFIENPANLDLRAALSEGRLTAPAYFEELLRLIYRLIFLFVAEDRGLLHPETAPEEARRLYASGYGMGRLRERAARRSAWDGHGDLWAGLKVTLAALARGEPRLGLSALGGLFQPGRTPWLESARIENRFLLAAIWRLAWFRPSGDASMTRVNWRDMQTEELGSVYESLLELTPRANAQTRRFSFAEGEEGKGHARKTSGSYYTPDALVSLLLDTTLDPLLDAAEARNRQDPTAEILRLAIIDPACGSGHFLLGAARRAAERIATHRSEGAPSQGQFQHALREVVSHCLYGVDKNPMAVELCRVALWIEAIEPGKPLAFLESRIRCGDSLIGVFDSAMLRAGLPDAAFKAHSGDDKEAAKTWRRYNKEQRDGKLASGLLPEARPPEALITQHRKVLAMPEETLEQVQAKEQAYKRLHQGPAWQALKTACDLYVAAFFLPKREPAPEPNALGRATMPLTESLWRAAAGQQIYGPLVAAASEAAHGVQAFHWHLEFPDIFARGGFDAVVGNPPWERVKLQEQEYFAAREPAIAQAPNKAARDRMIRALADADPDSPERRLYDAFITAKREAEATSEILRGSGRFPLTGVGDVNTYALFAEHFSQLARRAPERPESSSLVQMVADSGGVRPSLSGRAGVIVPTGIATDSSTAGYFGDLIKTSRLISLYDFQTGMGFFDRIGHARFKFCILVALGQGATLPSDPEFGFFFRQAHELEDSRRFFRLSAEQIEKINPNTRTAPVFRSRADAELTAKLYDRAPVLIEERPPEEDGDRNPWGISFQTLFHMSNDSYHFATSLDLEKESWERDGRDWVQGGKRHVPLYEAKMIHHFDHRWATYGDAGSGDDDARDATEKEKQSADFEPTPRYWVPEQEVWLRAARVPARLKTAWRKEDPDRCLVLLAEWLVSHLIQAQGLDPKRQAGDLEALVRRHLGAQAISRPLLGTAFPRWLAKVQTSDLQLSAPLTPDDLLFIAEAPVEPLAKTAALIDRKQPRWLMGWRDICRSTDERTVIASVFPLVGVSNKMPIIQTNNSNDRRSSSAFIAHMTSIVFDFAARQKLGGTTLNYFILKQFPTLTEIDYSAANLDFLGPRILELTYTSHAMRPWAEDLGHSGLPFAWNEDRRAQLRAELDAFFALKYGLTRDELRYVLDPADAKGPDYPSETFRVLKKNEEARFGEYRTQRLVLEAFDRLTGARPWS